MSWLDTLLISRPLPFIYFCAFANSLVLKKILLCEGNRMLHYKGGDVGVGGKRHGGLNTIYVNIAGIGIKARQRRRARGSKDMEPEILARQFQHGTAWSLNILAAIGCKCGVTRPA
jgi:hypothetical protein